MNTYIELFDNAFKFYEQFVKNEENNENNFLLKSLNYECAVNFSIDKNVISNFKENICIQIDILNTELRIIIVVENDKLICLGFRRGFKLVELTKCNDEIVHNQVILYDCLKEMNKLPHFEKTKTKLEEF